jgi:uncharacterized protein (TIGR02246 family)
MSFAELVARQARAWEEQDVEAILDDFHPDAVFAAPGMMLQGHDQIGEGAQDYFDRFDEIEVRVTLIVEDPSGLRGAVEWHLSARDRATGQREGTPDAIIVELRDGLITRWREYIDTATDEPAAG